MKKLFIGVFCALVIGVLPVCANEKPAVFKTSQEKQEFISQVGFRILNANRIKERMVFQYEPKKIVNAYTSYSNRKIVFYEGLMNYTTDEDQVAAVLSHEISHGIDFYSGVMRGFFSIVPNLVVPRKFEQKADKRAIDFMVHAGYNPVAMIVIMNKTFPQYRYEFISTHPLVSRRMAYVYEYIYFKYPEFLKNNKYQNDIYYQNFLLNSQDNRRKLKLKIELHSTDIVNYD